MTSRNSELPLQAAVFCILQKHNLSLPTCTSVVRSVGGFASRGVHITTSFPGANSVSYEYLYVYINSCWVLIQLHPTNELF